MGIAQQRLVKLSEFHHFSPRVIACIFVVLWTANWLGCLASRMCNARNAKYHGYTNNKIYDRNTSITFVPEPRKAVMWNLWYFILFNCHYFFGVFSSD